MLKTYSETDKADCAECGETCTLRFSVGDTNRHVSQQVFRYFHCNNCGLVFLDPVPADLSGYYPSDYYGEVPESESDILAAARAVEQYKIDLINTHCKSVRSLLEIGPSMGAFLSLVKHDGYEPKAIEMDPVCSRFINEKLGIPCIQADDELIALDALGSVDAIVMWQVIEHLENPYQFLRACISKLSQGGYLVLSTPSLQSLQFRLLGARWVHVDAPRHVSFISRSSMEKFLRESGLVICLSTTTDKGSRFWNKFGWIESMRNIFPGKMGPILGRISHWIMRPLERFPGCGSSYTVIARKALEPANLEH